MGYKGRQVVSSGEWESVSGEWELFSGRSRLSGPSQSGLAGSRNLLLFARISPWILSSDPSPAVGRCCIKSRAFPGPDFHRVFRHVGKSQTFPARFPQRFPARFPRGSTRRNPWGKIPGSFEPMWPGRAFRAFGEARRG